jgi:hypothetical protein
MFFYKSHLLVTLSKTIKELFPFFPKIIYINHLFSKAKNGLTFIVNTGLRQKPRQIKFGKPFISSLLAGIIKAFYTCNDSIGHYYIRLMLSKA